MRKSLLLFLFFYAVILRSNAQVGYIIDEKNDTIKGEVKLPKFSQIQFKAFTAANFSPLDVDTVKEYQLPDSSVWVAKALPITTANFIGKPQFILRLEHGSINLYQQVAISGDHITTWYVSKGSDSLTVIKTSDIFVVGGRSKSARRKILAGMFSDQPEIASAFSSTKKFDFDTIWMYIRKYNKAAAAESK